MFDNSLRFAAQRKSEPFHLLVARLLTYFPIFGLCLRFVRQLHLCDSFPLYHQRTIAHVSMADSGLFFDDPIADHTPADVKMGSEVTIEIDPVAPAGDAMENGENGENDMPFQDESGVDVPVRVTYVNYLKSPIIGLRVGQGEDQCFLTAHQGLLVHSPWFAEACAKFSDDASV